MADEPDVLEQGRPDGSSRRRPVLVVALVLVAAVAAYGVARATGTLGPGRPAARPGGSGSPRRPVLIGGCAHPPAPRWTAVQGGGGGRLLAGGAVLQRLDLGSGRRDLLLDPPVPRSSSPDQRQYVTDVAVRGDIAYALVRTCYLDGGAVYAVPPRRSPRRVVARGATGLLAGPAGVWAVTRGDGGRTVLRGVAGRTRTLAQGAEPVGVARNGVVVSLPRGDGARIGVVDPDTGRTVVRVGHGDALAVSEDDLVWYRPAACGPGAYAASAACVLHRTDLATGRDRAYRLPGGWSEPRQAGLDPAGRRLAVVLGHYDPPAGGRPGRFGTALAVLDLRDGGLDEVPGLRITGASAVGVGLTFLRGGRLVVSVGAHGAGYVLLWRPGAHALRQPTGPVDGPPVGRPAVVEAP